ncbi:selenide, water dikinase [Desulfovibrio ferrophilus]|uniref:Selenide, water dikinase n=1 Tax=Desulfovibrio ferrophilus TaxID=241368 RepID=A0A2Z6AVC5_9BACT|nr:selenide, water dikinase [Desulfovibrio ferrophilus]
MSVLPRQTDPRILAGDAVGEDAAILTFPQGKALVQTVDFFTPIVNDPYRFGQIAAANALSDVYAMGGEPYAAMNIVCFPIKDMDEDILKQIISGGYDKVRESGAVLAGGHSVEDQEIKFGLAVSGIVDPDGYATNAGLRAGDNLLLTKPLGTGVLATAIKGKWEGSDELEELLYTVAARLNKAGAEVIRRFGLTGATDVTGFGLGGHLLEMARASKVDIELHLDDVPLLPRALELAAVGLIPAGSYANKHFCEGRVALASGLNSTKVDLVFDAQTSGGLVLAVPDQYLDEACQMLESAGDVAARIGRVRPTEGQKSKLLIR